MCLKNAFLIVIRLSSLKKSLNINFFDKIKKLLLLLKQIEGIYHSHLYLVVGKTIWQTNKEQANKMWVLY